MGTNRALVLLQGTEPKAKADARTVADYAAAAAVRSGELVALALAGAPQDAEVALEGDLE